VTAGEDAPVPGPLIDAFMARARLSKARRGQIVIAEGSETSDVYLIRTGKVQFSLFSPQGREVILRELTADRIFGEAAVIDGLPRSVSAIAREDSTLAQMRGEEFLDLLETVPGAALWMSRMLGARVRSLTERAFELATLPVAGRVQSELLRLARESGAAGDQAAIDPLPTHAELAARIGTHREAVTRELNLLAADGILRQSGRRVDILSTKRLQSLYDRIRR